MYKIVFLLLLSLSLKAQQVYKTPSGKKYHTATCHTVKNVSEAISKNKAREIGLQPCKICRPQDIYVAMGQVTEANKAQGENESVQCKGTTKTGNRCKHKTRIANGYCFQHDPDKN